MATDAQVSQEALEALVTTTPEARISQEALEALVATTPEARVSQEVLLLLMPSQETILVYVPYASAGFKGHAGGTGAYKGRVGG